MTERSWRVAEEQPRLGYITFEILQDGVVDSKITIPDTPLDWPEEDTDGR